MAGAGRAAELGILVRGGEAIERASAVDLVLFDKTGTITEGRMTLAEVVPAQAVGRGRGARARRGRSRPGPSTRSPAPCSTRRATAGCGAAARASTRPSPARAPSRPSTASEVRVGAPRSPTPTRPSTRGPSRPDAVRGPPRRPPDRAPRRRGRREAGGRRDASRRCARWGSRRRWSPATGGHRAGDRGEVGIDDVTAEVFPDGKVEVVAARRAAGRHGRVRGRRVNDAPALAAPTWDRLGTGTDVALAAADVQLLGGTLHGVVDALAISRRTSGSCPRTCSGPSRTTS